MPVVFLVDTSLSMCQNVKLFEKSTKKINKKDICTFIIQRLLEQIIKNDEHENVAIVAVSSNVELVCEFTKDHEKLFQSLSKIHFGDQTCIEKALTFVSDYVIEEWSCNTNVQIVLITDGIDGLVETESLARFCEQTTKNMNAKKDDYIMNTNDLYEMPHLNFYQNSNSTDLTYTVWKYPFPFPNSFDIICLNENEKDIDELREDFICLERLVKCNSERGKLYITKCLRVEYLMDEFLKALITNLFTPFTCDLCLGHLTSNITLTPPPILYKGYHDYRAVEYEIGNKLEICGFINTASLITSPTISAHLIIPQKTEIEKSNCFAILLQAVLKTENMAAVVYLRDEWFGAVYPWTDTKTVESRKRYHLMFSMFVPGIDAIANSFVKLQMKSLPDATPLMKPNDFKSYTKNCIAWLKPNSLISDMQKIIRNAKKMPEKTQIFYKELNRVRRGALSFGFYELLDGLALMLEREAYNNANQEIVLQLNHVARGLRSREHREYERDIEPISRR